MRQAALAVRVEHKVESPDDLPASVRLVPADRPAPASGEAVIEVHASGVNPSDVKAVLGGMPHAVWPRTPGRDYAGVVIRGPKDLLGREVWGSGGELGISRDGAHARYLVVSAASVREKPRALSVLEAGSLGVPFITAFEGLREAGSVQKDDVVLALGANGKVGQAVCQLAAAAGARVFGVERKLQAYRGHAVGPVTILAGNLDWPTQLREATGGHGADIVYNTVGSPYFEAACRAMALGGRQIFISTIERSVPFDIFQFYRGRHRFIGVDSLSLSSPDCADILDVLRPMFDAGTLKPFALRDEYIHPLERAADAYQAVLKGAPERVVITAVPHTTR